MYIDVDAFYSCTWEMWHQQKPLYH